MRTRTTSLVPEVDLRVGAAPVVAVAVAVVAVAVAGLRLTGALEVDKVGPALGLGQVQVLGLGARGGLGTYPSTPLTSRSCPASTWRVCRRMWGQRPVRGLHQCRAPLLGDMCSRPRRTLPWPRSGS